MTRIRNHGRQYIPIIPNYDELMKSDHYTYEEMPSGGRIQIKDDGNRLFSVFKSQTTRRMTRLMRQK
jgi:hypothetical protein